MSVPAFRNRPPQAPKDFAVGSPGPLKEFAIGRPRGPPMSFAVGCPGVQRICTWPPQACTEGCCNLPSWAPEDFAIGRPRVPIRISQSAVPVRISQVGHPGMFLRFCSRPPRASKNFAIGRLELPTRFSQSAVPGTLYNFFAVCSRLPGARISSRPSWARKDFSVGCPGFLISISQSAVAGAPRISQSTVQGSWSCFQHKVLLQCLPMGLFSSATKLASSTSPISFSTWTHTDARHNTLRGEFVSDIDMSVSGLRATILHCIACSELGKKNKNTTRDRRNLVPQFSHEARL